jgi:hypothetical protein
VGVFAGDLARRRRAEFASLTAVMSIIDDPLIYRDGSWLARDRLSRHFWPASNGSAGHLNTCGAQRRLNPQLQT